MNQKTRWLAGIIGAVTLLFGLGCLNYTKMGNVEHHTEIAQQRGWPVPSRSICSLGMLLTPIGAGLVGFAFGRRRGG